MYNLRLFLIALIASLLPLSALGNLERVSNFGLIDHQGSYHQLQKFGDSKAVVIVSTASSCEANINNMHKYRLLQTTWKDQGVAFIAINSSSQDSLEEIRQWDELYNIEMPILVDDSQLVAENLGISRAGEIVVLDPRRLQVLYRGSLDIPARRADPDNNVEAFAGTSFLNDTLSVAAADEISSLQDTVVATGTGCNLEFPARDVHLADVPDYATEIAPILIEKCASCHREGGIAPFAMDSHLMVKGWSPMMKEVMMTKRMPPAQVDPSINHFSNARYMSPEELQTLVHWIDAGSPLGDIAQDPLAELPVVESEWALGEPDYIVNVPATTVPPTGVLDYKNVTIDLPFEEDVWVKSVQFLPGDRRVLHHLLSYVVPAEFDEEIVEGENDQYREFLEGYAPGKDEAATYPENSGVFVPQGSAIQMSLHYTTFGTEAVDETLLGLYFADETPEHQYHTYSLSHGGSNIVIPPGASEHKMSASYVFDEEVMLHGLRPHMHYRGKHMRFRVVYPDGGKADILNVPDYNFAWQPTYRLSEPVILPAGSRVIIEGAFDNSQYNPGNPDPSIEVQGGLQSWDEMFIGYLSYHTTAED